MVREKSILYVKVYRGSTKGDTLLLGNVSCYIKTLLY